MSRFMNRAYDSLEAYVPGEQPQDRKYIKLNTNESPYPPSDEVIAKVSADEVRSLNLYSDPLCKNLTKKIAKLYDVEAENVFITNGSDDSLNFAFMAFSGNAVKAYFPDISYGFYPVFAQLHGVEYTEIPLKPDFSIDVERFCKCDGFIVIANPNAPTGKNLPISAIEKIILANKEHVVLIDEAYVDFGGESAVPLIKKYDNLLVVQTFSKSRSLAGGRLGFAIGNKELIEDLQKLKFSTNPYAINRLSLVAGEASIDSNAYYMENARKIIHTREYVTEELESLGFEVLPSCTNFVFARTPDMSGEELYLRLKDEGILVRHFNKDRIKEYLRITIGTMDEMMILIEKIKKLI